MANRALGIEQNGSNLHNFENSIALLAISWKFKMKALYQGLVLSAFKDEALKLELEGLGGVRSGDH